MQLGCANSKSKRVWAMAYAEERAQTAPWNQRKCEGNRVIGIINSLTFWREAIQEGGQPDANFSQRPQYKVVAKGYRTNLSNVWFPHQFCHILPTNLALGQVNTMVMWTASI
jgi:hypothetical protein